MKKSKTLLDYETDGAILLTKYVSNENRECNTDPILLAILIELKEKINRIEYLIEAELKGEL